MASIDINTRKVKESSQSISSISSSLRAIESEINSVISTLRIDSSVKATIKKGLRTNLQNVSNARGKVNVLASTLSSIVTTYSLAEKDVMQLSNKVKSQIKKISDALQLTAMKIGSLSVCKYSSDPVNVCNGNFIYEDTFLRIDCISEVKFGVFYNSQDSRKGLLGKGWRHNYELEIVEENDLIKVIMADGSEKIFSVVEESQYIPLEYTLASLQKAENHLIFVDEEKTTYVFNIDGKVESITDLTGNQLRVLYDEDNRIIKAENQFGDFIKYTYESDKLCKVSDYAGREIRLEYSNDLLNKISDINGQRARFEYSKETLTEIYNARNILGIKNIYDNTNRVAQQKFPDGGVVAFEYDETENKTTVIDQKGIRTVYYHDDYCRCTRIVYPDGEEIFKYNNKNLKEAFIDKKGNETKYKYDNQGNLIEVINASGQAVQYEYTEFNQVCCAKVNGEVLQQLAYNDSHSILSEEDAHGNKVSYKYNDNNQIEAIVYADGNEPKFEYDRKGNLIAEINNFGGRREFEYDELHRIVKETDALGNTTTYQYNIYDKAIQVCNAKGDISTYKYDASGNLIESVDFNGNKTSAAYNVLNKVEKVIDAEGNITRYEYDKTWRLSKVTDACGTVTEYQYDAMGRKTKEILPNGAVNSYQYDANGNLIERIDGEGAVYQISYDSLNRSNKVTDPCGRKAFAEYDALSNVTKVIHPDKTEDNYTYDAVGQCISAFEKNGIENRYDYNAIGKIYRVSSNDHLMKQLEYYPGGLLRCEKNIDGTSSHYQYDKNSNLIQVTNQNGAKTEFQYDGLNQLTQVLIEGKVIESYEYDAIGNIVRKTDGEGNTYTYEYSPNGNIASVTDANGHRTEYGYDKLNQLISIKQGEDDTRSYQYVRDAVGNVTKIIYPDGTEQSYKYDLCNRLISHIDADKNCMEVEYYADGQEKEIRFSDGRKISMEYDAHKELSVIQDSTGKTCINRDERGFPKNVIYPTGEMIQYEYGDMGEEKAVIYPNGVKAEYAYDEAMRLLEFCQGNNKVTYNYYENGQLKNKEFPGGFHTIYQYDSIGRIVKQENCHNAEVLEAMQYGYDGLGRKNKVLRKGSIYQEPAEFDYQYNANGNLEKIYCNHQLKTKMDYDNFGNRIRMSQGNDITTYAYNQVNQLMKMENDKGQFEYSYDKRGNLTKKSFNGQELLSLEFDAQGLLRSLKSLDGETRYEYNGLGQRVSANIRKTEGEVIKEQYLYNPHREYNNLMQYGNGQESTAVFWDGELLGSLSGAHQSFFMNDYKMSPVGKIVNGNFGGYSEDVFGNYNYAEVSLGTKDIFGFTGYMRDEMSGLYFSNGRQYDAESGRFISRDSNPGTIISPITMNPYIYCYGDPVNYWDPTGEVVAWLAIGAVNAVANIAVKAAGDVAKSVVAGEWKGSSWQSYVGTATGGFAQGATFAATGNIYAASAAGSAVESLTTNGLNMATGVKGYRKEDGYSWKNMAWDATKSTAASLVTTGASSTIAKSVGKYIKIPGINKGKGSYQSVWKQLVTKASNGTINNISWNSIYKGAMVYGGLNFIDSAISKTFGAVKDKLKEALLPDDIKKIVEAIENRKKSIPQSILEMGKGNNTQCAMA